MADLAYGDDLAYVHHTGFSGFIRDAAPGLLRLFRGQGIRSGRVVDLGCGSGIWAAELSRRGYDVTGIDISPSMIALARLQAPDAEFRQGSFLDADLGVGTCHAVTALGECLNYGFDRKVGARSVAGFFRRVFAALRPGGLFVFDVHLRMPASAPRGRQSHWEGKDWVVLLDAQADRSGRTLTRTITAFRGADGVYRRSDEIHRMRLYDRADLLDGLRRAGFQARVLRTLGRFQFDARHRAFLSRKP